VLPDRPTATTSFHPVRAAKLSSRYHSVSTPPRGPRERCGHEEGDLHRREIRGARREDHLGRADVERQPLAVDLQPQIRLQRVGRVPEIARHARIGRVGGDLARLQLLERRDLGHVDEVPQGNRVPLDLDGGVLTDAEVTERMRRHRRGRCQRQGGEEPE
jgi:hypothetical protein